MLMPYEISETGTVKLPIDLHDPRIQDALRQAQEHYQRTGFKRPWVFFLAFEKGACVGSFGFKSIPQDGKVEIAYFPFTETEDMIVSADMIRKLIEIANFHDKGAAVTLLTPPQESPLTALLKRLEFTRQGGVDDPSGKKFWEWSYAWAGSRR